MSPRITVDMEKIKSFCRKWKVKELSLFGSVLTDDFRPESDVDVLVELRPGHGLTLYDWLDMADELKAIFGREVDLVAKRGLKNPFRRRNILESAEVVYAA
ncbi:MAG TPA: nucleotidyltransferase family protein [bacterium]|nr:nucleotidyltransferase family protein [bacterium]